MFALNSVHSSLNQKHKNSAASSSSNRIFQVWEFSIESSSTKTSKPLQTPAEISAGFSCICSGILRLLQLEAHCRFLRKPTQNLTRNDTRQTTCKRTHTRKLYLFQSRQQKLNSKGRKSEFMNIFESNLLFTENIKMQLYSPILLF